MLDAPLERRVLLVAGAILLVISGIAPHDMFTWVLEIIPVVVIVPILIVGARRTPLTQLVYRAIFVHACILMLGGHYTYAEVPLGFWVRDALGLARNHYDRLGHLAQGFVPALAAREVLLRFSPMRLEPSSRFVPVLAVSMCLAFSAFYELLEWWAAVFTGENATAFLGTQGDVWDTQWDMFLCLVGALVALLTLSRAHDRALEAIRERPSP